MGDPIVVFPLLSEGRHGVTLVMQPPLQAHMNIAALLIGSLVLIVAAVLEHELTSTGIRWRKTIQFLDYESW